MKKNWINNKVVIVIALMVIGYIAIGAIRYFASAKKNTENEIVSYKSFYKFSFFLRSIRDNSNSKINNESINKFLIY